MIFKHKSACLANNFIILFCVVGVNICLTISLVHCRNIDKIPPSLAKEPRNGHGNGARTLFSGGKELNAWLQSFNGAPKARATNNKESSTSEFIRLVTMRLIYGLAATMGVEDRLQNIFNGAFVPPNANEDSFGLDGLDDYADGDDDYSDPSSLFRDVIEDAF